MARNLRSIDEVRASRDGHEFHEAWTARKALQLLLPSSDNRLVGIAVEGLHPADQPFAASETVEIADLVLYYGKRPTFEGADNTKIIQFKYSISHKDDDFRASHARKTIVKFAAAYLDHKKRYGAKLAQDKLEFELITNRPIYAPLEEAIIGIANGESLSGERKKQADQFITACGLNGKSLIEFARRLQITGLAGNLSDNKRDLSQTVVDWSAATDALAQARLGALRQMVRDKAGSAGTNQNIITRVDVLAALDIAEVEDLLPCPASLPDAGKVVEREQLAEAVTVIAKLDRPLLIHAAGGMGKTVFLESLVQSLSDKHEVILFDCFGGGSYRSPEDSRHLPKRGLVHIVNTLACRGLCDPLLPGNDSIDSLIRTFRRRLSQCVSTLATASPERQLILFIDAIDNAAEHAEDMKEPAFPTLILESFHHGGGISGVKLVVSCRSHRITKSVKDVPYHDFKLRPFSIAETEIYLQDRMPAVTPTEIQVAHARSGGNARILEHLVTSDRGLLDKSEVENTIELDDLLSTRIQDALSAAISRGYKKEDINAFLAGLSVLPPPVPLDEYAGAHGFDISAIESFAADLAPLLERTNHGLMFRDEPTETLIRETFGSNNKALRRVANNLLKRQNDSIYAARALPTLLQKLDDSKLLFKLAFDERLPTSITSTVGKRKIQYSRLKAASHHAAIKSDYNKLVRLLVELSTITAVDQRGANYILDYPDLVIAAQDVDATRRLFETRTPWPGTRHARLTIANALSGVFDEAIRHANSANEWIYHFTHQDRTKQIDREGPEMLDIAAIPFCLITQNRGKDAMSYTRTWKQWAVYEAGELLFYLLRRASAPSPNLEKNIREFLDQARNDIGIIAAALSFLELDNTQQTSLIKKLAKANSKIKKLDVDFGFRSRETNFLLQEGLLKALLRAVSLGLKQEALAVSRLISHQRPGVWSFRDQFSSPEVFWFLVHTALISILGGKELQERDVLPKELIEISSGINGASGKNFKKKLKQRLEKIPLTKEGQKEESGKSISYDLKRSLESFIDTRLEPLLLLTKSFTRVMSSNSKTGDDSFLTLLDTWSTAKSTGSYYAEEYNSFLQMLGGQLAVFAVWVCPYLNENSVKKFLEQLHTQKILSTNTLIKVVSILSSRKHLHSLAGEQALKVSSRISEEYDVVSRASLFAQLARAILPASRDEAVTYFKAGLEQMDAIGSGDYQFINELLLFASSLRGDELTDKDVHTLTNICELNMPDEAEKFPWADFAKALSKTSGGRTLAKLARWDDRTKVPLEYSLLPYLTALIDDDKIDPDVALALNQLADPAELYVCSTAHLAKAVDSKNYSNRDDLFTELIRQYVANNPGIASSNILKTLASIAEEVFGKASDTYIYLSAAQERSAKVGSELSEQMNYHPKSVNLLPKEFESERKRNQKRLRKLASLVDPTNEASVAKAIDEFNAVKHNYDFREEFFDVLRSRVPFSKRSQYINTIAQLENLHVYTKLDELKKCKAEWKSSSAALSSTYQTLGILIIRLHPESFISFGQLSNLTINEVSEISEVPQSTLALELIKTFTAPDYSTPASVWLGLASIVCKEAEDGEGRKALIRLLNSNSAQLASNVMDGKWKAGLYPSPNMTEIASGLVWRMLGSPYASDRWRAAHSVRCFAKFSRWDVIDTLVKKLATTGAGSFQASELPFYYMHARLWFLIALARISIDFPKDIARYSNTLVALALDEKSPHVLMRHFASQAILTCVSKERLKLSQRIHNKIRAINASPFPQLKQRLRRGGYSSFYTGRPKDIPEPKQKFHLDYDFQKHYVYGLGDVFGKPGWEISDLITEVVRGIDSAVDGMYTSGGRERHSRNSFGGMTSEYHNYGQQLGWHALFIAAGKLLLQHPVTDDSYDDRPWEDFLGNWILTRKDGLWLSDGVQKTPLMTKVNLLEKGKEDLVITGNEEKIMGLLGFDPQFPNKLVVYGDWHSPDNIEVTIRSALVEPSKAFNVAKRLIDEEPFFTYIPTYDDYEYGLRHGEKDKYDMFPWINKPSIEGRLDDDDPLACPFSANRPQFTDVIAKAFTLTTNDPHKRTWLSSSKQEVAQADAWGRKTRSDNESSYLGSWLLCAKEFLREVLDTKNMSLLILIKLRRYEKSNYLMKDSRFSHTIAVLHIQKTLAAKLYMGSVNKVHVNKY